jgi:hypothetical protein
VVAVAATIQAQLAQQAVEAAQEAVAAVQVHRPEAQELKDKEMQVVLELVVAHLLVVAVEVLVQLALMQSLIKAETEAPVKTLEYQVFQNGMPVAVVAEYIDRVVLDQAVPALVAVAAIMPAMVLMVHLAPAAVAVAPAVEILMVPKAAMAAQAA